MQGRLRSSRYIGPAIVGGGRYFPDGVRVDLELLGERHFCNGVVYLRYGVKTVPTDLEGSR